MILLLDNFDSFTYNLVDYFRQIGLEVVVKRNDDRDAFSAAEEAQAIVLSPGPGRPEQAGIMSDIIGEYVGRKPFLGICLGHQALAVHFGAQLIKAKKPMHGKVSDIHIKQKSIFKGIPLCTQVTRYHSLVCTYPTSQLELLAYTADNEMMAFKHIELDAYGLQFHPEAVLTKYGLQMLKNWAIVKQLVN